jgi:hypothetical protein
MTGFELQMKSPNLEYLKDGLTILQELGETCGMREIGIAENSPEIIETIVENISRKAAKEVVREIKDLMAVVLDEIALAFGNHPSFKLAAKFEELEDNVNAAMDTSVVMLEEDGYVK